MTHIEKYIQATYAAGFDHLCCQLPLQFNICTLVVTVVHTHNMYIVTFVLLLLAGTPVTVNLATPITVHVVTIYLCMIQ